jgi:hypothetical protein
VNSSSPLSTIHHQEIVGSQSSPNHEAATALPAATQVTQRSAEIVRSGRVATSWPTWVFGVVGWTSRLLTFAGADISSNIAASRPSLGFW